MVRSHKEISDIVERLHFYLNQCSGLDDFHVEGESPVVIGDAFVKMARMQELTVFCTEDLARLLKNIINEYA